MNRNNITINYPELWGQSREAMQAKVIEVKIYQVLSPTKIETTINGIDYDGIVGHSKSTNVYEGWFRYNMTPTAFAKFSQTNRIMLNCEL